MSDELEQQDTETTEAGGASSAETENTENTVPYTRFKEVNDQLKALRAELEELKPEEEEDPLERANAAIEKHVTALKENLPDHTKALLDKLPMPDQLEWLSEHGKKAGKSAALGIPKTPNGDKPGDLSEEDKRKQAARTF